VAPALAWARAEEEVLQELERLQQEQRRKMVVLGCWGWIFWAVWDVFFFCWDDFEVGGWIF
jgi:hypothetical protein